ncbi:MAG TPA: MATE family efflux transporter [bacterium]|nr:MATE family efflux transporter [bacterium]
MMRELDKGDIKSHIIHLSWPMVLVNVMQNAVSVYEMYLVGRLGLDSLAALAIIMISVYMLFFSVHGGLINGAIAVTSRLAGQKRYSEINDAVVQMGIFAVFALGTFCAAFYIAIDPILVFFGAEGAVFDEAKAFLRILAFSFFPTAVFTVMIGVFRGAGDSITPLKLVILLAVTNAVMNTVFVGFLGFGLKGVAVANLTGWSVVAVFTIIMFARGKHYFRITAENLRFKPAIMKSYAEISGKAIAQNFVGDAGNIIMLKLIAGYGIAFIAAFGVVFRLIFFLNMFGWPIGNSGGVVVGQNLGSGNRERAKQAVKEGIKVYTRITAAALLVFLFFGRQIMGLFSVDAEVIKYGTDYLMILAPFMPVLGAGIIIQAAFNGAGSTGRPTLINLAAFIVIRFAAALFLVSLPFLNEYGIFWAMAVSIAAYSLIGWIVYKRGGWLDKKI